MVMQYATITTAQALYAALGMSVFASALAIVLTVMAYVHLTGRWDDRGERDREREQDRLDYLAEVEAYKAWSNIWKQWRGDDDKNQL